MKRQQFTNGKNPQPVTRAHAARILKAARAQADRMERVHVRSSRGWIAHHRDGSGETVLFSRPA